MSAIISWLLFYFKATIEISEILVNFDIMCAGDSSTVMCIHSAGRTDIKQWDSDVNHCAVIIIISFCSSL